MTTETKFKSGDIVKLKSGGPDMTIQRYDKLNDGFRCQWFAGKKLESGIFPAESIEFTENK
jgi:uncharacterized protein YodC (DUF2158 family)